MTWTEVEKLREREGGREVERLKGCKSFNIEKRDREREHHVK